MTDFTPRWSGPQRRFKRQQASVLWGTVSLITVMLLLLYMYVFVPAAQ